ncbi:hypothetical protein NLJ89_g122 [Agrocybe chaxingu]|uniref:Uncharacterized protein n=1 Tax=Agrocybe chaxingu TaxID=84603 RepID=A0A9W8N2D5_9AGAR|nr:hypothetical protein NLJ89_g122 [Agrocybe chaxingu]
MQGNDTVPATVDGSKIALGAAFSDNGVAHSIKNTPLNMENLLVRLNTSFAPNGEFGTLRSTSVADEDGRPTFIGYDAAFCLEIFEPWVLELISFTNGEGPYGYTSLSPELYAKTRAEMDVGTMLPYFAGSGSSVAWQFPDREISSTSVANLHLGLMIAVLLLGAGVRDLRPHAASGYPKTWI